MPMDLPAGRDQIGVSFAYRQGVADGPLGSGWGPIQPGSVGEALAKQYC